MTKFVGDALGARSGSRAKPYTSKERQKNMVQFLASGHHPDADRMRRAAAEGRVVMELPPLDPSRPHIFLQLSVGRKDAGRVVIELFDDVIPPSARHFQTRCTKSATDCFAGTRVHKVLQGLAIFGGKSQKFIESLQMKREPTLRHVASGAVSISRDGAEFCLAVEKAMHLDETHQVIGQVVSGMDVVRRVAGLATTAHDAPVQPVFVERCGLTDARGAGDNEVAEGRNADREEGKLTLEREADAARQAVHEALVVGMKRKETSVARTERPAKKGLKMDALLLGGSSESDTDSDSSDEAG